MLIHCFIRFLSVGINTLLSQCKFWAQVGPSPFLVSSDLPSVNELKESEHKYQHFQCETKFASDKRRQVSQNHERSRLNEGLGPKVYSFVKSESLILHHLDSL